MGHFVDVFLFKCFNRSRYSIDPKIQLSVSFLRDGNHTFHVFPEIKWWMVPFISPREENSLPTGLCSPLASGTISRAGHGLQLETSVVHPNLRWFHPFSDYTIVFRHQAQ